MYLPVKVSYAPGWVESSRRSASRNSHLDDFAYCVPVPVPNSTAQHLSERAPCNVASSAAKRGTGGPPGGVPELVAMGVLPEHGGQACLAPKRFVSGGARTTPPNAAGATCAPVYRVTRNKCL